MTALVTWNIQYAKGCDGRTDIARIADVVRAMGETDVVCLQEVSRGDPDIAGGADQLAQLRGQFLGYAAFFAAGPDRSLPHSDARRQFGNLILSRLPVLQAFRHLLPRPAQSGIKHMQRVAVEAVVATPAGPLRIVTTHLEYYSERHRAAQIARLRELHSEVAANEAMPSDPGKSPYDPAPRPASLVLCGDLNLLPDDPEYQALFAPFADGTPALLDAWRLAHPGEPDPLSTGLYDKAQWKTGPHCRDYFAVTPDVAKRLSSVEMDDRTDASDHQPLRIALAD